LADRLNGIRWQRGLLVAFGSLFLSMNVAWSSLGRVPAHLPDWAVQLGYFASAENAQTLRKTLEHAGFEAAVVATGAPARLRYRVIAGWGRPAAELNALVDAIADRTGLEGYVTRNPMTGPQQPAASPGTPFELPSARYLLAQAAPQPGSGGAAMRVGEYESGLYRTPQEDIESIPGFTAGGFQIVPTIGLKLGYDDNITFASSNEISSWFYMISPAIRIELPTDQSVLALIAGIDFVRYDDSPIDDREPWWLRGEWTWDISTRQKLDLFGEYREGVDRRGEGRRQGDVGLIPVEPDEWQRYGFGGLWDYGAIGSRGRLELQAGYYDLEYTNNREPVTPGDRTTRILDRDWQYYGGTFYWRIAPKSSLLVDYLFTDTNYKVATQTDSEVQSWLVGLTWDATARTSGEIAYGNQRRDFDDPTVPGYDGPTWRASIQWRPRSYSSFTLAGSPSRVRARRRSRTGWAISFCEKTSRSPGCTTGPPVSAPTSMWASARMNTARMAAATTCFTGA
jgi:hypothetical protein